MKDILTAGLAQLGLTPPPGAIEQLCQYSDLLLEQNRVMNLTAITQPDQVARLHFLDSAAILALSVPCGDSSPKGGAREKREAKVCEGAWTGARASDGARSDPETSPSRKESDRATRPLRSVTWLTGKTLIDVGTGAGFPGLVLKILEPSLTLTLADSLGKRITWLESVCARLGLEGVTCLHVRAEELALDSRYRDGFDVATSRAVAAFPALCELCLPLVKVGGQFIAMKSLDSDGEIRAGEQAVKTLGGRLSGHIDYPVPGAGVTHRLVVVDKRSPTPRGYPRSWGKIKKAPL